MGRTEDRHPDRVYMARSQNGVGRVWIAWPGGGRWLRVHKPPLCAYPKSQEHAWGYGGSGPAQLAYDLLFDATGGDCKRAAKWTQDYKWAVVSQLPQAGWTLARCAVLAVLERLEARESGETDWDDGERVSLADPIGPPPGEGGGT